MSSTCLPATQNPWGPILDSEFKVPCPPGTCNPGRINTWAGFGPCATGGHEEPRRAHQTQQCPHYRLVWGGDWDDEGYMKPQCTPQKGRFWPRTFTRVAKINDSWR